MYCVFFEIDTYVYIYYMLYKMDGVYCEMDYVFYIIDGVYCEMDYV